MKNIFKDGPGSSLAVSGTSMIWTGLPHDSHRHVTGEGARLAGMRGNCKG